MGDSKNSNDLQSSVFGNSLIFEKLSKYLHLGDLKTLRMTNQLLCSQVLNSQTFKNKVCVHWKGDIFKNYNFLRFLESHPKWKSFAFSFPEIDLDEISTFSSNIANSEINHLKLLWEENSQYVYQSIEKQAIFEIIIFNSPGITKLEMDFNLLCQIELPISELQNQGLLRNVLEFRICLAKPTKNSLSLMPYFNSNLNAFGHSFVQLQKLSIGKIPYRKEIREGRAMTILSLIKNNFSTLKYLKILCSEVWKTEDIGNISFPKLKSIEAHVDSNNQNNFRAFLSQQPPLQEIVLSVVGSIQDDVLHIVQEKHFKNLKKLHIDVKGKQTIAKNPFGFLKNTGLVDFSLVVHRGPNYNGCFGEEDCESIMKILPPCIEKLKLRGIRIFPNLNDALFADLTELNELSLIYFDYKGQPNSFFEKIVTEAQCSGKLPLPKLTALELVNCNELSGKKMKGLKELKGLRKLRMSSADLTDEDILALNFSELNHLDISGNSLLSAKAIEKMMDQTPSLEYLRCSQKGISKKGRLSNITFLKPGACSDNEDSDVEVIPITPALPDYHRIPRPRGRPIVFDTYYRQYIRCEGWDYRNGFDGLCRSCGEHYTRHLNN